MISSMTEQLLPTAPQTTLTGATARTPSAQYVANAAIIEDSTTPAPPGDTVTISDEARQLAASAQGAEAMPENVAAVAASDSGDGVEIPEGAEVDRVADVTMTNGKNVVVERVNTYDETLNETFYWYKASVFSADGEQELSFRLKEDTIITQDENGNITGFGAYAEGDETSGDDIIFGKGGSTLSGGEGDDVLISLSGSFSGVRYADQNGYGSHTTLDGGDGDDTIVISPYLSSVSVDAGDGDDVVDASEGVLMDSGIVTGDGDDTVRIGGMAETTVDTGDGDDTVHFSGGVLKGEVTTGDGDDTVESELDSVTGHTSFTGTKIDAGDGNDTVRTEGLVGARVTTGAGNDTVSTGFISQSTVDTGDGSDSMEASGDIWSSSIAMGAGDDSLTFGNVYRSTIDTGDGDDIIKGKSLYDTLVNTGDGADKLDFSGLIESSFIFTGRGRDVFLLQGDLITSTLDAGDGDDTVKVHGSAIGNRIYGGDGRDRITLSGDVQDNSIDGGEGRDRVLLSGTVDNNHVYSGTGADADKVIIPSGGDGNTVHEGEAERAGVTASDNG